MFIPEIQVESNLRGSKMVTGTQTETEWDPGIRDFAATLQTHLAEVKHKWELKLRHPEPLAHGRLLYITTHWKNRRVIISSLPLPTHWPDGPPLLRPTGASTCQPNGTPAVAHHKRATAPPDTGSKPN
jgi:hypothetical protein